MGRDVVWGWKGELIKKMENFRKVCTQECVLFLLTTGSVASDIHTTRLMGLHGWHDRVTCCDLKTCDTSQLKHSAGLMLQRSTAASFNF